MHEHICVCAPACVFTVSDSFFQNQIIFDSRTWSFSRAQQSPPNCVPSEMACHNYNMPKRNESVTQWACTHAQKHTHSQTQSGRGPSLPLSRWGNKFRSKGNKQQKGKWGSVSVRACIQTQTVCVLGDALLLRESKMSSYGCARPHVSVPSSIFPLPGAALLLASFTFPFKFPSLVVNMF